MLERKNSITKKKRIILTCIILIATFGINLYLLMHRQNPTLFCDNAKFTKFSNDKVERFVLKPG